MSFVQALLSDPAISAEERQEALNRAFADPGIPDAKNTTSSFWLKEPHPNFATAQSPLLPCEADVVIIGSGITSASVARTLLEGGQDNTQERVIPKIVILEARDVCSGATGRNGGHALETAEEFIDLEERFGLESAKKLMRLRLAHLHEYIRLAEEYGLTEEAQVRKLEFLSAHFDEKTWSWARKTIERFKECMPEESKDWRVLEKKDISDDLCMPHAVGIIAGPAGALWPYKFITGIFSRLQEQFPGHLTIETNTPVTRIQTTEDTDRPYTIRTPRGIINARHVIHCTNAHVGSLVPGLRGRIYPIRGQMSAQAPGEKFPNQSNKHSWLFNYQTGYDYLTQLPHGPHSGGEMMFGGGFAQSPTGRIDDLGISTDSELGLHADIHLSGALSAVFGRENWGAVSGPAVKMMWTGNMGFSADGLPWVGRLPSSLTEREALDDSKGSAEWVCAAFSGEGMVHAWLCGKPLAMMVLDHDRELFRSFPGDLSWFPEEMKISEERVHDSVLPRSVDDIASSTAKTSAHL